MGIFGWLKPEEEGEDRSLLEISNDSGDHFVADIPTSGVKETEKALRKAGVEKDKDESLGNVFGASRVVDNRDSKQHRFRSERVVDEAEDLEDSHDRENDTSDEERSEQSASWFSLW